MTENSDAGKLAEELHALADDAEALLQSSASANGTQKQRERVEATLRALRGRLARLEEQAGERARQLDGYVRENPWEAVAVAGGVGLILGLILATTRR
jgi:ElaB/YqjD/DUF883 family membrane-anchored ribosome-binding protein